MKEELKMGAFVVGKVIKMKRAVLAVMALVLLVIGGLAGCASYSEVQVTDLDTHPQGQLFKITAKVKKIERNHLWLEGAENKQVSWLLGENSIGHNPEYKHFPYRVDFSRTYTFYITGYNYWYITRVDGELKSIEEGAIAEAAAEAEANAKKEAEEAAKAEAERKAQEAKWNPNNLDRSQYKGITVEDFAFDMAAGKLPAGTKVSFAAYFLTKPTGTSYRFRDVNLAINLTSSHNFVRSMPRNCFESYMSDLSGWIVDKQRVRIYVTIQKPGQAGESSVDIVEWNEKQEISPLGGWN
jgi:hypothetical protein